MALYNQKNNFHAFVCGNANLTAESTTPVTAASGLNTGEVAFLDKDNCPITDAGGGMAIGDVFRIVHSDGTTLHYSPFIKVANITHVSEKAYAAATQQVSYIGYVGSGTTNIEAIDDNNYIIRILIEGTEATFGNKQMYKFGAYKSSAAATSAEVAIGLVDNLTFNFKREAQKTIQFDAICNVAVDASYDFTQSFTAVQGEDFITTGDLAYNTAAGTLAVGDYIRVADDSLNGTLDLTDPVYKVIKITGTTKVQLDRPWTNATGTWTDAGDGAQVIPAATGVAAQWGIKCTGIAQTNFKAGVFNYTVPTFKIEPQNCGTTTVTYSTVASKGTGTRPQVQELEWFAQGNLGNKWRVDTPPTTIYDNTASGGTYNMYTIKYNTGTSDSVTGTTPTSTGEIVIAGHTSGNASAAIRLMLVHWYSVGVPCDASLAS